MLPLALVAAVARNGVIGIDNGLPWSLPSDLRHFRALTLGKPVLMGRRTFESIGRPLPGRHLVVLSRDPAFTPAGIAVAQTLDEAMKVGQTIGRQYGAPDVIVAGGATLYAALISRAQTLHITEVDGAPAGDTLFPTIDPSLWRETERVTPDRSARDDAAFAFVVYRRP